MRKILERCPTCNGDLVITEVRCLRCTTEIRGRYAPCPYCRLADDQLTFLNLFLENRGNLTDLEKQLGVSYPTIRGKLDEIIRVVRGLDHAPGQPVAAAEPSATTASASVPSGGTVSPGAAPSLEAPGPAGDRRRAILEQIAAGQLDPVAGLERIRELST
ncbi:MAG: DUF2089 domain-containing protein [Chloroflexi bacterium]|nr:DUF2089 domain-containing protein [Chloroflexota bacterium]